MANTGEPIIMLDPNGKAPIISYNVPDATTYSGRNYIELRLPPLPQADPGQPPPSYFKSDPGIGAPPPASARVPTKGADLTALQTVASNALSTGVFDTRYFPNVLTGTNLFRLSGAPARSDPIASGTENPVLNPVGIGVPVNTLFSQLDPPSVALRMQAGERLNVYRNLYGTYNYNFLPEPVLRPRLMLVETYRLSSFLGNYGAGKTLKTFTLLPGEKTTISIKTYMKTETDAKSASSILDSFTQESSDDFEQSVQQEQSDKQNTSDSFEYHADADAHASWGWGSANISGGIKGGSNSAREEFAKNVASATAKHAAKASAKRDVQVNTSFEVKEQAGEETSIERDIQNINVSRTLNAVFRQMNQAFVTLLHLTDVRVAFFNGYAESRREVPLFELDSLLDEVVVDDAAIKQAVKSAIIGELQNIFDYQDTVVSFIEEKQLLDVNGQPAPNQAYWRVKKSLTSTYEDAATGMELSVPGIIVAANTYVLRTEGVMVEALIGQGDGLDPYSQGLQDEAIRAKVIANDVSQAQLRRELLAQGIVTTKDEGQAKEFVQVFPPLRIEEEQGGNGDV